MLKADSSASGTASSLTPVETKISDTVRLKCAQAELMLQQARSRLAGTGIEDKPAESNQLTKLFTRLDKKVGDFLVGKGSPISVLHEAGFSFVQELQSVFPETDVSAISAGWPKVASAPLPTKIPEPEMASTQMYSIKGGVVQDSVPRLRLLGMDTNTCVGPRGVDNEFWRITKIRAQSVVLVEWFQEPEPKHNTTADKFAWRQALAAKEKSVELADFVAQYVLKKPVVQQALHPMWPPLASVYTDPTSEVRLQGERVELLYALGLLSRYCAENFPLEAVVDVYSKPKRSVVVKDACPVGTLLMPPDSVKVNQCKAKPETPEEEKEAACDKTVQIHRLPGLGLEAYRFYLAPMADEKKCAPAWYVETTDEPELANMIWGHAEVILNTDTVFPFSIRGVVPLSMRVPLSALDAELDNWQTPGDANLAHQVVIPVLVNWKELTAGETLLVWKGAGTEAQKPPKPVASITIDAAIKRRATQTADAAKPKSAKKPKK